MTEEAPAYPPDGKSKVPRYPQSKTAVLSSEGRRSRFYMRDTHKTLQQTYIHPSISQWNRSRILPLLPQAVNIFALVLIRLLSITSS
ncbi:hypothetical protein [Paenibacillus sp. P32E]|uniref:hypothetical protein n=1 Tax=Paenibacillus sp. P32E TaxID=1349434 RepID=UPI00093EC3CF|nr:hypothetical protein [Paenibacillus sp. P32E]OKP88460.1 hypothetical protein A3848_17895 [Paenibacillus sp. P32E]